MNNSIYFILADSRDNLLTKIIIIKKIILILPRCEWKSLFTLFNCMGYFKKMDWPNLLLPTI